MTDNNLPTQELDELRRYFTSLANQAIERGDTGRAHQLAAQYDRAAARATGARPSPVQRLARLLHVHRHAA